MSPFTESQTSALQSLLRIWPTERFVIVGATAVAVHLGLGRRTYDLDLTVAASPGSFEEELRDHGWSRDGASPQRWLSPGKQPVDIIPASTEAIVAGGFTWPDGSATMSLVGFRMTFANAARVPIDGDREVQVATVPTLVVLKIAAYMDSPSERSRDLEDLAYMLDKSVEDDSPDRWSSEIVDQGLEYDDVGPYVLGREVARKTDAAEMDVVCRFVESVLEDPGQEILTKLVQSGRRRWGEDSDVAARRVEWFGRGLRSMVRRDSEEP